MGMDNANLMKSILSFFVSVALAGVVVLAQEDAEETKVEVLAGHSAHSEAFNEGPRQAAQFMGNTGNVHFPVSTESREVQEFFDQGIGQLHGFWYLEAERSFRHAAALDPSCAMTYWGMAMANVKNRDRAKGFVQEAVDRKEAATPRERQWIESLERFYLEEGGDRKSRSRRLIRDLEALVYEYPDDLEAKAFLVVTIYENRGSHPIGSHQAVSSLIQQILEVNPQHPVHHYRIHLWDYEKAERALASAALCGQSAPGIAHMWHMPGHIFSRLHRYADAAWQQEASARVDHTHMMRTRLLPDQIFNYAHNNEWLIRNLNYIGRVHDAVDQAKNMIELPRHPRYNDTGKRGSSAYHGRQRLLETLIRYELWEDLEASLNSVYLEALDSEADRIRRQTVLGLTAWQRGDLKGVAAAKRPLKDLLRTKRRERIQAANEAEEQGRKDRKSNDEIAGIMAQAMLKHSGAIDRVRAAIAELDLYVALEERRFKAAKKLLDQTRGISAVRKARLQLAMGEVDQAVELIQRTQSRETNRVYVLAAAVEILQAAGRRDEAIQAMKELQERSGHLVLDVPVFERLTALAPELGFETDWKRPYRTPEDVGVRPDLEGLGTFRWSPGKAPDFRLSDAQGKYRRLSDYRGKPLVLIFYLGYGCAHCVEQINLVHPRVAEFAEQGVSLVAVSTETLEELNRALTESELLGALDFPVLSNGSLDVFKEYRAFDDFENVPLHGTFLIDGEGRVRWQEISYEPFEDIDFLLKEARRLLAQSSLELASRDF